jgi:pyrroline-5-carboxylate reductase
MMSKTIGFIGGGQMAEALIKGLLLSKTLTPDQINVAEPIVQRRTYITDTYSLHCSPDAKDIIDQCDFVVLAVKPQVMAAVLTDIKTLISRQIIVTIAAGLPLSFYSDTLGSADIPVIRVMPNTPALILEGASALCRNDKVSDRDLDFANKLFASIGTTTVVDEKLMDGVTGLSGSGPAYVFSFIEALIDGGIKVGLSRDVAEELAIQTVIGSARLVKETGKHPAVLRAQVTSPGGTTIAALQLLENSGFNGIIMEAVEASCKRSHELGKI